MNSDELTKQVEREQADLTNAPAVTSGNLTLRCHFCGQVTSGGTTIYGPMALDGGRQTMHLKGVCCGG